MNNKQNKNKIKTFYLILLTTLFLISSNVSAKEQLAVDELIFNTDDSAYEQPVLLEPEDFEQYNPYTKEALRGIIEKDYDTSKVETLFREQLKHNFSKGPISELGMQAGFRMNFSETFAESNQFITSRPMVEVGFKGRFKNKKDGFNILLNPSGALPDLSYMQQFVYDAWLETNRIKNHRLLIGTSRIPVGYEGGQSAYLIPFLNRTQSARTIGNTRKTGIRLQGEYKYVDYDIGGYSSDSWYREFFPGIEGNLWLSLKPLANFDDKYGKLIVAGGLQAGDKNSTGYIVSNAAIKYDYKKAWFIAQYTDAEGSNGADGITNTKRMGYDVTFGYKLTKKLEFLLRYDDFVQNKQIENNHSREYTTGLNYFILGQGLRLILNYTFCQNQQSSNSHKIMLGTQILI